MTSVASLGCCHNPHADKVTGMATVLANRQIAVDTWKIRLVAPGLAPLVRPGQFLMLRLPGKTDPLLGRAFAVYSTDPTRGELEVVYLVVGKMTRLLTQCGPNDTVTATGPLGNGWQIALDTVSPSHDEIHLHEQDIEGGDPRHLIMVAGGIGHTPFYMLTQYMCDGHWRDKVQLSLLYGARTQDRFSCLDDFATLNLKVHLATEDGSAGTQGYVSDLLAPVLQESGIRAGRTTVLACGPEPMLKAVFAESKRLGLACWVSLETRMGCGLGICFGCVVRVRDSLGNWDYRRTCVDGPVFDAWKLDWN
ncbi:MAG: dihydroorotate dehydrogenase electron transfer subunit [Planctomycetia bacterium]|nr:dihydroorotate dehydrogenase electron transfer subunit [Planctomycetia bacterium]